MIFEQTQKLISSQSSRDLLAKLYGQAHVEMSIERYMRVAEGYFHQFGQMDFEFFSSPGRTEIIGNHTDHNQGKVLAGSINLDCVASAGKNHTNQVVIISETFNQQINIDLNELQPTDETTGTKPLLKGILAGFLAKGYLIGGFNAYITSNVISSAGVSSSASFEMLICCIINYLFNENQIRVETFAQIGKYAENKYWNKQSGLLDQMACAVGGLITIDFKCPEIPIVQSIDFNFDQINYDLLIVNTGKGHADLSEEYSSVPIEMKKVAAFFNKNVLAEIDESDLLKEIEPLRAYSGDRAVLRALHFFEENKRIESAIESLENHQYEAFLEIISASGNSSWKWLQNCYSISNSNEQSVTIALALTELFIASIKKGACRVHGGGFAGVIMAIIPKEHTNNYIVYMEDKIGKDNVYLLHIRKYGVMHLDFTDFCKDSL